MYEASIGSRLYNKVRCTKDVVVIGVTENAYVVDGVPGLREISKQMVGAPEDPVTSVPFCLWSDWFTYGQEMQAKWLKERGLIPS